MGPGWREGKLREVGGRGMMGRRGLVFLVGLLWAVCAGSAYGQARPNILFILVDDLGFGDLSYQGSRQVRSPNIDSIAEGGAVFSDAYSTATFCSPARGGIMTGRHPSTFGHIYNAPHTKEDTLMGTPPRLTIMPQTLRTAGYRTMIIGKWHLGFSFLHHPLNRGFQKFYGFLGGKFEYFQTSFFHRVYRIREFLYDDYKVPSSTKYLTTQFTDKAIQFISDSNRARQPFFLYLSYNAPHSPYQFLPGDVDPRVPPERRKHVAMIKSLDDNIGRILARLRALGILSNTLIVFTNDNGGHPFGSNNGPLRDFKNSWFEGGLRVPFFMMWKGKIRPGQVIRHPITLMDLYPTFQVAARVAPSNRNPRLQGKNILRHVTMVGSSRPSQPGPVHSHIVMGALEEGMVRQGDWKLYVNGTRKWLFNLARDIGESNDVKNQRPAKVVELNRIFRNWQSGLPPPHFPEFLDPQPLRVSISGRGNPRNFRRNTAYTFSGQGSHARSQPFRYTWETFRTGDRRQADFNVMRSSMTRVTLSADRKRATVRFSSTGRWTVRVNVNTGRFWKWADLDLVVN